MVLAVAILMVASLAACALGAAPEVASTPPALVVEEHAITEASTAAPVHHKCGRARIPGR